MLPDVERAIEVDNLRRFWYVSERSVPSRLPRRAAPQPPPPARLSPVSVSRWCEYRRDYEHLLVPAVLQLHGSRPPAGTAATHFTTTIIIIYFAQQNANNTTAVAAHIEPDSKSHIRYQQGVALTERNTTGPPWSVTDTDRR